MVHNSHLLDRYISKSEKESATYIKATKAILSKAAEGKAAKGIMQKYLIQSLPRDLPRQECFLLMSKRLHHIMFSMSPIHVSLTGSKKVYIDKTKLDAPITKDDSYADVYWKRESDPNYQKALEEYEKDPDGWIKKLNPRFKKAGSPASMSLHSFMGFMKKDWTPRRTEMFPCISPYWKDGPPKAKRKEAYDDFCRARLP